jgi:hypothetical protein
MVDWLSAGKKIEPFRLYFLDKKSPTGAETPGAIGYPKKN